MKKFISTAILSILVLSVFPMASAAIYLGNIVEDTLVLQEKNPVDWSVVQDGNCGGLDYTGDSLVNYNDKKYIQRNKVDANNDGIYTKEDIQFIGDNYQNCRAGTGLIKLTTVRTPWRIAQERMDVEVHNLKPSTDYQLIYYGNTLVNDVWPYATCIGVPRKTSSQGFFNSGSAEFKHLQMVNDGIAQKFWVVLADDVDCTSGKMTAWNPTEYLFEANTI